MHRLSSNRQQKHIPMALSPYELDSLKVIFLAFTQGDAAQPRLSCYKY